MLTGQGASVLLQALYFALIGRALGSREYGVVAGVVALVGTLGQLAGLGMEMVLVRNVSRGRESFQKTWGDALLVSSIGFLVLLGVLLAAARALPAELRGVVPAIAVADGLFGRMTTLVGRAFQGAGELPWTARVLTLSTLVRTLAAAVLFALAFHAHRPASAELWSQLYLLASLAGAAMSATFVTRRLGWPQFRRVPRSELAAGLSFSLSSSSITVFNDIDKMLLAGRGLFAAAGIYGAAYRIVDVVSTPVYSLYAAATPRIFREGAHGVAAASVLPRRLLGRTLALTAACAAALFLAAPLLPAVFGSSFAPAVAALRWLCLLPLLRALHYCWGTAITGSSSQWYRTGLQASAAALNLMLNLALIPRYSWRGAAAASLLTDGALALGSWALLQRLLERERRGLAGLDPGRAACVDERVLDPS